MVWWNIKVSHKIHKAKRASVLWCWSWSLKKQMLFPFALLSVCSYIDFSPHKILASGIHVCVTFKWFQWDIKKNLNILYKKEIIQIIFTINNMWISLLMVREKWVGVWAKQSYRVVSSWTEQKAEANIPEFGSGVPCLVFQARIPEWVTISFSSGPRLVRTLHWDPSILDGSAQPGS